MPGGARHACFGDLRFLLRNHGHGRLMIEKCNDALGGSLGTVASEKFSCEPPGTLTLEGIALCETMGTVALENDIVLK